MATDDATERTGREPVESARQSLRRALERAEDPEVRRELREALQLLYAVGDAGFDGAQAKH
jgi:hypothetical protein